MKKEIKNIMKKLCIFPAITISLRKEPKTKTHSLVKVFIFYIILFSLIFLSCLFIPNLYVISAIALTILIIYIYLLVETKYKLREFMKHNDSLITIDETGIENKEENKTVSKLYWDAYRIYNCKQKFY